MGAIWEIAVAENGATFWIEAGRRYVACRCDAEVVHKVEARTGLKGAAALRAAEQELAEEAARRLAAHVALPLKLAFQD
jgi:hypothetical protein